MLAKEGVKAGLSSNDTEQPPFLQLLIMDDFSNSSGRNSSCLWICVQKALWDPDSICCPFQAQYNFYFATEVIYLIYNLDCAPLFHR